TSLFTDAGAVTYLTSQTDDLTLGGTSSTAPFFYDESQEELNLEDTVGTSSALRLYSNVDATATSNLFYVHVDNPLFDQDAIQVQNDGVGTGIDVNNDGTSYGVDITNGVAATSHALYVRSSANAVAASELARFSVTDAAFDQDVIQLDNAGIGDSLYITQGTTGTGRGLYVYSDVNATSTGPLGEFNVDNVLFDQTALLVSNDGTGASFRVDDVSGDTSPFVVDTSGNVGILNSTPGFNLDVSGTASVDSLNINSAYTLPTADGTSGYVLTTDGLGAVTWAAVAGGSSLFTDGGTITYLTSVTDDLALGGSTSSAPFFFDESAEELILTNTTAGDSFRVNDVASDTTPFLIDTSGNISVGGNLVTIGTNTLGDASADSTTIRGTTTMTDSASGFPLTFGADTSLYRGAANGLYLATGDSLTIVSGSSTQTSPATTTTAHGLTVNSLTTGTGIAIGSTATAITSGKLLTLTKTGASGSVAFTGDIANITYSHTFNGGVAQNSTGNTLDISRAITLNNAGNTHTVSGALLLLADSGTQTAGTLTHTAGIIDATQNYTASTGTAVYFKNYGAGNSFRVDDVSGDTSPFIVDTAGDVGIGTTTTTDKLSVTAAASQDVAVFTTSGGYTLTFDQNGNLYRTGNGAGIYNTDGFMAADTYQSYSTNTDLNVTAQGTGQLVLQGSSSGNVGIGTAAPDSKLHISDASQVSLTLSGTADNSAADIDLFEDYTANAGIYGYNITYNGSVNRFDIGAYDGSASVTTHLSILRASGNVGIGTNNPGSALHVSRTGTADDVLLLQDSSGSCEAQPTTTGLTWSCSSDQRLKTNITDASSVLDYLNNIPLKDYTVIKTGEQVMGPIAQEMQILYPELVHMGDDGYLQVSELTPWQIVKAIQEQQLQIESLSLDETGNIIITGNNPTSYAVSTSNGIADRIASFAETTIAKIKAGAIYTEEITANNIKVNGQILSEYITSVVQTALNNGELISPIDSIATIGSDTSINIASESGSILIKDNANKTVATISDKGELSLLGSLNAEGDATISGSLSANSINTNTIATNTLLTNELNTSTAEINNATVSGTLYANNIDVASARIAALEVGMAQLESIKSNTADIVNATISGTLYANNIYDFENKIATSLQQPGLLDLLTGQNDSSASANYLAELYDTVNSTQFEPIAIEDLDLSLEELNLTSNDIALTGSALFIEKYFKVNGAGYISDSLAVGNNIFVGDSLVIGSNDSTTQIANGVIAYNTPNPTEQILKIQPSGQGSIELLAGVMTLNDTGLVMVNGDIETTGDVKVGKTLLANLIKPTKFGNPLQVQVAGLDTESNEIKESRFEIINEVGSPVATFSAQGKAEFAGGIGVGSEDLSGSEADEPQANRTSGKATIKQGRNEIKIKSSLVSEKSLIYVTAVGSTNNQVLFVKSQVANINGQEGEFVVGFDSTTDNDVTFNWWIVN
ncbi:tail fiber domain-containing protein, partial [Candidatus Woesebacteria bacterium]|nr:tail fiber domain-containing protein [Candidatus Woesebacteria bacterium]